ncbi:hypothetical protein FOZ63_011848, partial [Perkinsus olseni]
MGDWEVLKKYLSHSGRSGRENDVQDPEGQSRAAEKFRHTAERYNAVKALMKVPSGLHPRYMHRREVQGCIERWRQGLIERFAYYSGIWLNGKDGERRLAGMIWSAISCELPSVDANSRFEKFTRVCAETSARFCFLDVSYWVADWAEGQGLVTAAVIVMSAFVKEELCAADNVTELLLYCRDDNLRSQAVARGLGFLPTTNANADNCLTLQLDDMWQYRVSQAIRANGVRRWAEKERSEYLKGLRRSSSMDVKWRIVEECYKLEESEHSYDEEARRREAVLHGREILRESLTQKIIPDSMEIDRLLVLDGGRSAIASLRERPPEMERNQWQAMQKGREPAFSHLNQYRGKVHVESSQGKTVAIGLVTKSMSITLGYLSCILFLISVVAAMPNSLRSLKAYDTHSEPPVLLFADEGDVDTLAALLAAQVRAELSSPAAKDYLPQGLAVTAEDDEHPFWASLAAQ